MGLFGKKKETPKVAPQLKVLSFPMANGFRGFKKVDLAVHGVAEFPKQRLETKGQTVVLQQYVTDLRQFGWKVYLNNTHIGTIFEKGVDALNKDMVDAVYIKYETEIVNGVERWRPRMFVHYKE